MVEILFEDNHLLVVLKPHNMPTQADESGDLDLLTWCKNYVKEQKNKEGEAYIGLVHRLDRPTGGIMVFAKTSKAAARLCDQIKNKTFEKRYLTVVCGHIMKESGTLVHYLKKDAKANKVSIVPSSLEGAKKAELSYSVLAKDDSLSLVEVLLATGRSHQIRVQMSSLKTPIYSDVKYGATYGNKTLALFAYSLKFVHPTTKENMVFAAYPNLEDKPWSYFAKEITKLCK